MPVRKRRSFGDAAAVAKATDKKAIENPAEPRPKKPKAKPTTATTKTGRTPTVDYERSGRINTYIPNDLYLRLKKAVAIEAGERYPGKVDQGIIIEEALEAWMKKKKY